MLQLEAGSDVFTPWFERRSDALTATIDVEAVSGATVTASVYTKSRTDLGDGGDAEPGKTIVRSSTGRSADTWAGVLKELVRYRLSVTGAAGSTIKLRMLPEQWFDAVRP